MSFITSILGGGAEKIIGALGSIVDNVTTTDEERAEAKLKIRELIHAENQETEKTFRRELAAKERILVAELQQGDAYTKRARPSIIYCGLAIAMGSAVAALAGSQVDVNALVPSEFWYAWGGISSTWVVGRTMEKRGKSNGFSRAVTGSRLFNE